MDAIVTESLTRHYGRRIGVEQISVSVPEGSLFGFLGPNGAGKTTTIRVLLGFLRPCGGRAGIFGMDCWHKSSRIKTEVGYLPGDLRLYPGLNGLETLRLFGAIRKRDLLKHGKELAERFAMDLSVKVRNQSRGMRQKLGLILTLASRPRLLVLDEPTASLDPIMQDRLREHLRGLAGEGHTIFFSSHTLSEVEHLCDRVAILRDGRLVENTTLQDLRRRSSRRVSIRWKDCRAAQQPPPSFLQITEHGADQWAGILSGSATDLVRWAATMPIEDISISPPDLETLFHGYYEQGGRA